MIRIDWSGNFKTQENTELTAFEIFEENQKSLGIQCRNQNTAMCFRQLIRESYEKYGKKVVILIDEYDKPILDNLDNIEQAKQRRDFLRGMYVQMKANDAYIRFVFLTGISKFSKRVFVSGLIISSTSVLAGILPLFAVIRKPMLKKNLKNELQHA